MREPETLDGEIAIAANALARAEPPSPEDELARIERLVRRSDDARVTAGARDLLTHDAADVRVLGYFLFGVFLRFGPPALPHVFDTWHRALTEARARLRPSDDLDRAMAGALRWMLRNLIRRVDFHAGLGDATHAAWRAQGHHGVETFAASRRVRDAIDSALDAPEMVLELLSTLDARVRTHFSRPAPRPVAPSVVPPAVVEPPDVEPPDVEPSDAEQPDVEQPDPGADGPRDAEASERVSDAAVDRGGAGADAISESRQPAHPEPSPSPERPPQPDGSRPADRRVTLRPASPVPAQVTLTVTPVFAGLLRRLDAFARLTDAGDLERAAIVAADIAARLDAFDPRQYFPKLLGEHFRRVVDVADEIHRVEGLRSPRRAALEQLYRTDLDLFLG